MSEIQGIGRHISRIRVPVSRHMSFTPVQGGSYSPQMVGYIGGQAALAFHLYIGTQHWFADGSDLSTARHWRQ